MRVRLQKVKVGIDVLVEGELLNRNYKTERMKKKEIYEEST